MTESASGGTIEPCPGPDGDGEASLLLRAFLFTDIEGSTRLWEQFPVAMRRALAQHDALLFGIAERHGGHVFKTIGDAFCIAFSSGEEAVRAAVDAQQTLEAQDWGQVGSVRVRMAIHQGVCEFRNDDYFGPPLNRSARLRDAGHGGQILVSATVRDSLLAGDTPAASDTGGGASDGVALLDLGQHRLRDLSEPEHIYQVTAPGLLAEFPRLRTATGHPNNLPSGTTSFVGRAAEARAVRDLLGRGDVRLVTLTGMGGSGKTRLALDVAASALEFYPQGVWYADLAPIATPSLVLTTVLRACGLTPDPAHTPLEQLSRHFREATALLVLDNMEQVADAADDLAALLRATRHVKILATSRILLELSMEYEYAVPPLGTDDGVSLFAARAQQARLDFALASNVRPEVEAICERLDRLPLSIELAAAQMRTLSLPEIRNALDASLDVLSTRMRDLAPRQRSLRGAIDWSCGLLTEEERRLFRSLSIFAGGFAPAAAAAVCAAPCAIAAERIPALLERLRASSLVRQDPVTERFSLLESLRQYGQEQLAQDSERETAARLAASHTGYYLEQTKSLDSLLVGAGQKEAKDALEADIANVRAAQDRAAASGSVDTEAQFGTALRRFWLQQGYLHEGLERLIPVVARREHIADRCLAVQLLFMAGDIAVKNARFDLALPWFEESAAASVAAGDRAGEARALTGLGGVHYTRGELAQADACYERALAIRRELGDQRGEAVLLNNLALQAMARGDYSAAREMEEKSLALIESLGDGATTATFWNSLGVICEAMGDLDAARAAFERCQTLGESLGLPLFHAFALINLASLELREGRSAAAERCALAALEIVEPLGFQAGIGAALVALGRASYGAGDPARAAVFCARAVAAYHDASEKHGMAQALEALAEMVAAGDAGAARLFLATATALRAETGIRATPHETERIASTTEAVGGIGGAAPDLSACLDAAARLAGDAPAAAADA